MKRPNFLIVGAAKAGTTSLYEYLRQHPEVFMPVIKEPAFFIEVKGRGIRDIEDYDALFAGVRNEKAIGEASGAYLYDDMAPVRISDLLGRSVKIVIVLRNPIDMAYSMWGHNVRVGDEELSFQEALAIEEKRITGGAIRQRLKGWVFAYAYTDRGKYASQVKRYFATFGRKQVKIYIFEEFFRDELKYFQDLCRFLGVSDDFSPVFKRYNAAGAIRSILLREFINKKRAWKKPLLRLIPEESRRRLGVVLNEWNRRAAPLPRLSLEERRTLWGVFDEDITELEKLLDRDLRNVWQPE